MTRSTVLASVLLGLFFSFGAQAEDAESILSKAREMQLERWEGVRNYSVEQSVAGTRVVMHYERVDETSFRVVPQSAVQSGLAVEDSNGSIADFDEIQELAHSAQYLGKEEIGGRSGFHLKSDDVDRVETMGDQEVQFDSFEIWVDVKDYVPLKILINGEASGPDGKRPVVVNMLFSDYRPVPGSKLFEAYRHTMSMGGVLDPGQEKQLQEAMQQMQQMEAQLAAMPEGQRKMMEQMMGPKIEMMKKMASGGGIEVVTDVIDIKVNTK